MAKLLSVSEAADRLGVHIGTIRRWTGDGVLPESRTPGGHRRIPAEAVERLRRERLPSPASEADPLVPADPEVGPADEAWAEHAVVHTRFALRTDADAEWNVAFDGPGRAQRRETGRQLMGLLLRHVAGQGDAEARTAELRRLAWGYALDMKDRGLPISEALRATLFFRDVLTESTALYPRFEERDPADHVAFMRQVNGFMNEVQLTIAQAYESEDDA